MKTYNITEEQKNLLIKALRKAEEQKAFSRCVMPKLGKNLVRVLENLKEK